MIKTPEIIIDDCWDKLFKQICEIEGDSLYDLIVEYKSSDGKTIRVSWLDRENRLQENRLKELDG